MNIHTKIPFILFKNLRYQYTRRDSAPQAESRQYKM